MDRLSNVSIMAFLEDLVGKCEILVENPLVSIGDRRNQLPLSGAFQTAGHNPGG